MAMKAFSTEKNDKHQKEYERKKTSSLNLGSKKGIFSLQFLFEVLYYITLPKGFMASGVGTLRGKTHGDVKLNLFHNVSIFQNPVTGSLSLFRTFPKRSCIQVKYPGA